MQILHISVIKLAMCLVIYHSVGTFDGMASHNNISRPLDQATFTAM